MFIRQMVGGRKRALDGIIPRKRKELTQAKRDREAWSPLVTESNGVGQRIGFEEEIVGGEVGEIHEESIRKAS